MAIIDPSKFTQEECISYLQGVSVVGVNAKMVIDRAIAIGVPNRVIWNALGAARHLKAS